MPLYTVHLYPIMRYTSSLVQADSPEEAACMLQEAFLTLLHEDPEAVTSMLLATEEFDPHGAALVDVLAKDGTVAHSVLLDGDHQVIPPNTQCCPLSPTHTGEPQDVP